MTPPPPPPAFNNNSPEPSSQVSKTSVRWSATNHNNIRKLDLKHHQATT